VYKVTGCLADLDMLVSLIVGNLPWDQLAKSFKFWVNDLKSKLHNEQYSVLRIYSR
jgi:hypothetical protein